MPPSTEPGTAHGARSNKNLEILFECKRVSALYFRTSIKGALCSLGSATVVQDGTRSSGIDHSLDSHNVSPCLPNNFTSKMGKMELCDPVGPSPAPYRQLPFIFESLTPFIKEQGSPDSHSNPGKVNCNQYLLTFSFLPPADSKAYLLGKPGRQEVE